MKKIVEWECPSCEHINTHTVDLGENHFLDPRRVSCNDEEGGCGKTYFLELNAVVEVKVMELKLVVSQKG